MRGHSRCRQVGKIRSRVARVKSASHLDVDNENEDSEEENNYNSADNPQNRPHVFPFLRDLVPIRQS
jgi:hypothetical protein